MICWKCGNDITTGATKCLCCGANQNRSIPKSEIGRAMRQLCDRYGKINVLGKKEYLDKGLGEILIATSDIPEDSVIVRSRIRTAMNAGLGNLYLEQLDSNGRPDETFDIRVKTLLIDDAGLSEKAANEIVGYYDEMIGWRPVSGEITRPVPVSEPAPELKPDPVPFPHTEGKQNNNKTKHILIIALSFSLLVVLGIIIITFLKTQKKHNSVSMNQHPVIYDSEFNALQTSESNYSLSESIRSSSVGDIVRFGSYEQDNKNENGKEDIEWIILEKVADRALLLSRFGLDEQQYNSDYTAVTWETCSLRLWLNSMFLKEAFSDIEQYHIVRSIVTADHNQYSGVSAGNDTHDKIFLLSIDEAYKYPDAMTCQGTPYCNSHGAFKFNDGNCRWWLRSPGSYDSYAAYVDSDGKIDSHGYGVIGDDRAVRPALWIDVGS